MKYKLYVYKIQNKIFNKKNSMMNFKISKTILNYIKNIQIHHFRKNLIKYIQIQKINLLIISYFFKAKILIYWIDKNDLLNTIIINKNYEKKIKIFKQKNDTYDPVISNNEKETKVLCQELLQQFINSSVDIAEKNNNEIQNLEKQLLQRLNIKNYDNNKENYTPNIPIQSAQKQKHKNKSLFFNNESFSNIKPKRQNNQYPPGIFNPISFNGQQQPMILEESIERYTGKLKFFDEQKNYGFLIKDDDQTDIFVHYDDLSKANISKEFLKTIKNGNELNFSFKVLSYVGKYNKSRKAIELELLTN